jgi:hypothetical protein
MGEAGILQILKVLSLTGGFDHIDLTRDQTQNPLKESPGTYPEITSGLVILI